MTRAIALGAAAALGVLDLVLAPGAPHPRAAGAAVWSRPAPPATAQGQPARAALPARGYAVVASWPLPPRPLPHTPDFEPLDLALLPDGRLLVADAANNAVLAFDPEGRLAGKWTFDGQPGTRPCAATPIALALGAGEGPVYVLWALHEAAAAPGIGMLHQPAQAPGAGVLESRTLDGHSLDRRSVEASDVAIDPVSGDLVLLDAVGGWLRRLGPGDAAPRRFAPVGRMTGQAGALAVGRAVIAVLAGGGAVDLVAPDGTPAGRIAPSPHRARAVGVGDDGRIWLLVQADVRIAPDDRPIILRYGADGRLMDALGTAALGSVTLPNLAWPFTLDVRESGLALAAADAGGAFAIHRYADLGRVGPILRGGRARSGGGVSRCAPLRVDGPLRLAAAPDGSLALLDGREGQVLALDESGPVFKALAPPDAAELALGPGGARYLLGTGGALLRQDAAGGTVWRVDCGCPWATGLVVAGERVLVAEPWPAPGRIAAFAAEDGRPLGTLERRPPGGLWPIDLALGTDGRLFTGDRLAGTVAAFAPPFGPGFVDDAMRWATGPRGAARRLDAGWLAPGLPGLALVREDDRLAILAGDEGMLADLVLPETQDGSAVHAADLAWDPGGRLFLADPGRNEVHRLEPSARAGPAQSGSPPSPESPACRIAGERTVRPGTARIGEAVEVRLRLGTVCPPGGDAAVNLVLVVDRSASMQGAPLDAAKRLARDFVESLGADARLALVTFDLQTTVPVYWTAQRSRLIAALTPIEANGGTNPAPALRRADALLHEIALTEPGRGRALPVILLLTDGARSQDTEDPRGPALLARARGVILMAAGLGPRADMRLLAELAGGAALEVRAASDSEPLRRRLDQLTRRPPPGDLVIDELAGAGYAIAGDGAQPAVLGIPGGLRWGRVLLPAEGLTLTYTIRPHAIGDLPVGAAGAAAYADGHGVRRRLPLAPAPLRVLPLVPSPSPAPGQSSTPSPSPPPATATPAGPAVGTPTPGGPPSPVPTASPTATDPAAARPLRAFLPAIERCGERRPTDLVLVLDASTSMHERFGPGTKLDAVVAAVGTLWGALWLGGGDRAAVVTFNREAVVRQGLTGDRAALQAALDAVPVAAETRIDRGIEAALRLGAGADPGRAAVLVLVTDGRPYPVSPDQVLAQAETAKAAGFQLFSVGIGAELDLRTLRGIASRPGDAYQALDPAALRAALEAIAEAIRCSGA